MKIAIKGYIGSGKSTVSKIIAQEYGYEIIDADNIVAKLYEENSNMRDEIINTLKLEEFSKQVIAKVV